MKRRYQLDIFFYYVIILNERSDIMKILFIGDICGEEALVYLENNLNIIKTENKINLCIANAENVTGGRGLSKNHYQRLIKSGVNAITLGNHTYSKNEITTYIENALICRPANFHNTIGHDYLTINYNDKKITIISVLGRVFMGEMCLDCPFQTLDRLLKEIESDYILLDIHAEATSEKIAIAMDFDGKINAIVGTHTHVQTADERKLPKGTLYISDVGLTGPLNGIVGDNKDTIINRFRTGFFTPAQVETGDLQFNAVVIDTNLNSIVRIHKEIKKIII